MVIGKEWLVFLFHIKDLIVTGIHSAFILECFSIIPKYTRQACTDVRVDFLMIDGQISVGVTCPDTYPYIASLRHGPYVVCF